MKSDVFLKLDLETPTFIIISECSTEMTLNKMSPRSFFMIKLTQVDGLDRLRPVAPTASANPARFKILNAVYISS